MSDYKEIDSYVDRIIRISDEDRQFFHQILERRSIKKKEHLLRAGQICRYEFYVIKGCLRLYFLDDSGSEINMMFPVEDWWFGDLVSFAEQAPGSLYAEALEDSEVWMISRENKEALFNRVPAFERMFRLMIQRSLVVLMNRLVATISQPADERYRAFIERYPYIPQRIPQHHIASYLGVSPEFLSKIRRRMAEN